MKTSRVVLIGIVMVAIFGCWFNTVYAGPSLWPSNKGEICFRNVKDPLNPLDDEFVRLAVMRTIGNNYIVQGFVTEEGGTGIPSLFNGNAIVDGDEILMNVSASGYRGNIKTGVTEVYGSIGRVLLDASTLDGWVVGIDFHCTPPSPCEFSDDSSVTQTLTHISCD